MKVKYFIFIIELVLLITIVTTAVIFQLLMNPKFYLLRFIINSIDIKKLTNYDVIKIMRDCNIESNFFN